MPVSSTSSQCSENNPLITNSVFDPPEDNPVQKFSRSVIPHGKKVKDQTFGFDRIFDENVSQGEVYEGTTRSLLDSVLDGYNATVFAYGATGCGKTHTITGTIQQPGIIFLTMQELFERMGEKADEKVSEISLSYLEIYNETIRDLLVPSDVKGGLMLREDANQTVSVAGLSSHHPQNVQEVMDMIVCGNACRTVNSTEANATSSRSHAVLQINVTQKDRNADVNEPHTMATLSIIDLAGSERASATKNRGERLIEGANINKSLLALGSCINALCDPRKRNHVPYRNSKLTRLLKFSLGGNCRTVMIVCVSPSSAHFDETQNTLRYANRAKNIQTKVTRNVYNVNRHVKDYLVKIDEQRALIDQLRQQQKDYENIAFEKFSKQTDKKESIAREGILRIRSAYEHSTSERSERVANMKKLRQIEKRVGMLDSWVAAFDSVCEAQEDESLLQNLAAMRKTAQGILVELEGSRHHYQQKVQKSHWSRAIDSALQNGLRQIAEVDGGADSYDADCLSREAELLIANADREVWMAVADQEKSADAQTIEVLLRSQFETIAAVQSLIGMTEEEAIQAAKSILGKILRSTTEIASHVVKPDSNIMPVEMFPPSRSGTPKRKKQGSFLVGGTPLKTSNIAVLAAAPHLAASPMRLSPKRKKFGGAKKGVQFTPKKNKSPMKGAKRGVRWRDDTEDGALAEFEKTPKKVDTSPDAPSSDLLPAMPPPLSTFFPATAEGDSTDSSPIPPPPQTTLDVKPSSNRFKSGFLAKKTNGSPLPPTITTFSSDSDHSPLRDLEPRTAGNRGSSLGHILPSSSTDNTPNDSASENEGSSRWTSNKLEQLKIRNAIKRASIAPSGGGSATAMRVQRRRSPTATSMAGSPPSGLDMFTASHARRMVKSEKENEWKNNVLSPRTNPVIKGGVGRRQTLSGERHTSNENARDGGRGFSAHMASGSVGGSMRGSLVPGKTSWR